MTEKINDVNELKALAKKMRQIILKTAPLGYGAHVPSALSAADLVTALYFHTMNFDPKDLKAPTRDRFLLSAGHKCLVQYAALNMLGVISDEKLQTWEKYMSDLAGHPCYGKCPGVEASTGSLEHGFAMANGMALAARMDGTGSRVFTILGDGELAEGSNWEAAMFAAKYGLDNLVAIADYNNMSTVYPLSDSMPLLDLKAKFEAFGFAVKEMLCRYLLISSFASVMSWSLKKTFPPSGISNRFRQRKNVDFPPPLGPMMDTTSPRRISVVIPLRTSSLPKFFLRYSVRKITSVTDRQPPFQNLQEPGEHKVQGEVDHACNRQRLQGQKCGARNCLETGHQLADEKDGSQ